MRQVDTCDFCGEAPDGVFEVVPAAVPDGPVRLALCADCQRTLETVVDPLLDADAGEAGDGAVGDSQRDDTGAAGEPADSTTTAPESAPERTATTAAPSGTRNAADGPASSADADASSAETDVVQSETDASSDDTDAARTETDAGSADAADDGITIEEPSGGTPVERPDGYAQVLRLLENRDDGMPRSDLRSLATNAYDLTDASFEAAVEAAIENGDVEDTAGGLRRT
ncbi:hypothetical protein [Halobacterium rubrum]|uniref:hypothetical protein n=1 Tax=Halobacterium TaxID=2239 RepID=UPI001F15C2B9|nr:MULTISPECIES: hypothetical protein [Halobacterium]MDH5018864.1 hypothetical protein [Halobacterium rubrum]